MKNRTPTAAAGALAALAVAALAAFLAAGCKSGTRGASDKPVNLKYLAADTATPNGEFSPISRQFAYDGELVTFQMDISGGPDTYAVFNVEGRDVVVEFPKSFGRYEMTHRFRAGHVSQEYRVYATAFVVRGRRDWIYDKTTDTWHLHPREYDPPDAVKTPEEVLNITCYRREIRLQFEARSGPPKAMKMILTKETGERTEVPRRPGPEDSTAGFFATGAVTGGPWEVVYTPTCDQVSRAGTTHVELLIEHWDGSTQRIESDIDTP